MISEMTNLRSLELQDWDNWGSLKSLSALSLLEALSCHGRQMLLEIMSCASWSNLKAINLAEYQDPSEYNGFYKRFLREKGIDSKTALAILATRLLQLPQLASIQVKCKHSRVDGSGEEISDSIMDIISLHADQWQQLEGQPGVLLYNRIRC